MAGENEREANGADLVIAGGGLIGLACALEAAGSGLEVLVVDPGADGRASEVAAGMIAPVGEASWGEEALLAAALDSARRWPDWAERLEAGCGGDVGYRRCGALHVGLDRDEAAELRRRHELHGQLGLESEWMGARACRRLEPGLSPDVAGGYVAPREGEVDPRRVTVALRSACERAGVRMRAGSVASVRLSDGGVRGVELGDGTAVAAERVLLAAGAWLGSIEVPGLELPVRPMRGEICRLRARRGELPCERIIAAERVYIVPRPTARSSSGRRSRIAASTRGSRAGGVHELLREAYRTPARDRRARARRRRARACGRRPPTTRR